MYTWICVHYITELTHFHWIGGIFKRFLHLSSPKGTEISTPLCGAAVTKLRSQFFKGGLSTGDLIPVPFKKQTTTCLSHYQLRIQSIILICFFCSAHLHKNTEIFTTWTYSNKCNLPFNIFIASSLERVMFSSRQEDGRLESLCFTSRCEHWTIAAFSAGAVGLSHWLSFVCWFKKYSLPIKQ